MIQCRSYIRETFSEQGLAPIRIAETTIWPWICLPNVLEH